MNIKYPDYNNSIANLGCSILKYFGIKPPNSPLPAADALFNKRYKNVVVLLLDGMGVNILKKHLSPDGFFLRNMVCEYSSTFPPTTVAATTAIDSGLFPNQSAWLGWTGYFEEIDRNVVYFLNIDNDTKEPISDFNVAHTFLPYKSVLDLVRAAGAEAYCVAPYFDSGLTTFSSLYEKIKALCSTDSPKYIYAYWDDPDAAMHKKGIDGTDIRDMMIDLQEQTQSLADELTDTLLIITADHGHINVKNTVITDYPDICECLLRMPSMEVRALNIFVKPGMKRKFETAFNSHFSNEFMLLSKKEVYSRKLLGTGENHPKLDKILGDYLAVAVSEVTINNVKRHNEHMGEHAGITEDEMTIPLIAVQK